MSPTLLLALLALQGQTAEIGAPLVVLPGDSIQAAIDRAQDGDQILVLPGRYAAPLLIDGKDLVLRSEAGPELTVIDAAGAGRVVTLIHGAETTLEGFTLQGGRASHGAGVGCFDGSAVELRDNLLRDNRAQLDGGGVYALDSSLTLLGNRFEDNEAQGGSGGGAWLAGAWPGRVRENSFLDGRAAVAGGGLWSDVPGAELALNLFAGNRAPEGAGLYCSGPDVSIRGNQVRENVAVGFNSRGGGLVLTGPRAEVHGNTIEDNGALWLPPPVGPLWLYTGYGGGLWSSGADLCFEDNAVLGNAAEGQGGGVWSGGDRASFRRNRFEDNGTAWVHGGGLYSTGADLLLEDELLRGNQADFYGALMGLGPGAVLRRCQVLDNSNGGVSCPGSAVVRECLFEDNDSAYWESALHFSPGSGGTLERCRIRGNSAVHSAGGLSFDGAQLGVSDCLVVDNSMLYGPLYGAGGGVYLAASTVDFARCTIADNRTSEDPSQGGAGLELTADSSNCRITDSILWGNQGSGGAAAELFDASGSLQVISCDVRGGWSGAGNIDQDPLFTAPQNGLYTLLPGSPCVDAGSLATPAEGQDLGGAPRTLDGDLDGWQADDLGAFEFSYVTLAGPTQIFPGSTLTLSVDCPLPLLGALLIGTAPGVVPAPPLGPLLVDLDQPWIASAPLILPAKWDLPVPSGALKSASFVIQAAGIDPVVGVGNVSPALVFELQLSE